jgi:Peptidase M50B-like
MAAATHHTMLDQIGQTQAPLPTSVVVLLGLAVFAVIMLPTRLVARHVTTMAHEGAHALVSWAFGAKVESVTMKSDGSGLTKRAIPGSLGDFLITFAGYIGPSAFGLAAAKLISIGHIVAVLWLALLLLAALLITVRNFFALCVVLVTGFVLYLFARHASVAMQTVLAYVITWFLLLSGLGDVLRYKGRDGDAPTAAEKTHLPSWLWVGVWQLGAAVALVVGGKLLL